jgi:hypothetical protein
MDEEHEQNEESEDVIGTGDGNEGDEAGGIGEDVSAPGEGDLGGEGEGEEAATI